MPRFQINNNGTPANDLVGTSIHIMEAVRTAEAILNKAAPNGRDYQTVSDPDAFEQDRAEHIEMATKLRAVYEWAESRGLRAQKQRVAQRA